jgi:putative transposase
MKQIGRNLSDVDDGFLNGFRYLIHDRDPVFSEGFRKILNPSGVKTVKLPARSANLNAYTERFVRSVKSECLAKIIPLGGRDLRKAVKEDTEHSHFERNHHGLDNQLIENSIDRPWVEGPVDRRERLAGILNDYHRTAA